MTDPTLSEEIERSQRRVEAFRRRFGKPHLDLACHAAFPLFLTPDLLNDLWLNFQRDVDNHILNIPWIAIADLLLSGLCAESGSELYEMKPAVRSVLIAQLKSDPRFGQVRLSELSDFINQYFKEQLESDDDYIKDQAQSQRWTANAYVQPEQTAQDLARAVKISIEKNNVGDQLHLASIMDALADPLNAYPSLVQYARQRRDIIKGINSVTGVPDSKTSNQPIIISGVEMPSVTFNAPPTILTPKGPAPRIPAYIFGLRGLGGETELISAGKPGWIVVNVGISNNDTTNDFTELEKQGIGVIVSLENGFGEEGTIPKPSEYNRFANQCAEIVRRSKGARIWVIGNEPNGAPSRPGGDAITPELFARCFNTCRQAIRGVTGHENDWVIPGPVGPFISDTRYTGNSSGDWVRYFSDLISYILIQGGALDAIALHTFSFSQESSAISKEEKFSAPFDQNHRGFRAYRDFLSVIPSALRGLPVLITAARPLIDGDEQWVDQNTGWIRAAFAEINAWNEDRANQAIIALCLARWQSWEGQPLKRIADKPQVIQDLRGALKNDYRVRMPGEAPTRTPPIKTTPAPEFDPSNAFALIIGINKYKTLPGLRTSVSDAEAISEVLRDPSMCGYSAANVYQILDEQATKKAILEGLALIASHSNPDSTVLFYFNGFGARKEVGANLSWYIMPCDAGKSSSPDPKIDNWISSAEFNAAIEEIMARHILVIIDCSFAGGFGVIDPINIDVSQNIGSIEPGGKVTGVEIDLIDGSQTQASEANPGYTLLAATRADELAYSRNKLSVFSNQFVAALAGKVHSQDGYIRIGEMYQYLSQNVPGEKFPQHPILRKNTEDNFAFALYCGGQVHAPDEVEGNREDAYLDFDLVIGPTSGGYIARVIDSPAGQGVSEFKLPFTEAELEIMLLNLGARRMR